MRKVRTLVICILFLVTLASAQSEIGGATLNGTVIDPSGAAVAGAKVTAINTGTGLARETTSTSAGLFALSALPVGNYDLTIEASGFKASKRTGISLAIGGVVTLDARLEIGT